MKRLWLVRLLAGAFAAGALLLAIGSPPVAQEKADVKSDVKPDGKIEFTPEEKAVHDELIALRERLLKAYADRDPEGVLANLHENVVVTWQNGRVSRGHQGVRDFYKEMMEGPNSAVTDLKSKCTVDDWSLLYNDRQFAVAVGKLEDDFTLRNGMKFRLESRWTADCVKEGDKWKIAAFHVSTNMFDNGVMSLVVNQVRNWTAGIAGGIGLLLGVAIGWIVSRGRKNA